MGPTGNFQGSYKFLSLETGRKVIRKQFTELPMPERVIARVEALAARDRQGNRLVFANRAGEPFPEDAEEVEHEYEHQDDNQNLPVAGPAIENLEEIVYEDPVGEERDEGVAFVPNNEERGNQTVDQGIEEDDEEVVVVDPPPPPPEPEVFNIDNEDVIIDEAENPIEPEIVGDQEFDAPPPECEVDAQEPP